MRTSMLSRVVLAALVGTAGAVVAVTTAGPAAAVADCEATWVGPAGGDWGDASNWSPAQVPDSLTFPACLLKGAAPVIGAGEQQRVGRLVMTGSAIQLDGSLSVGTFNITDSDLNGAGSFTGEAEASELSGLLVSGSVQVDAAFLDVYGNRAMCGGRMSVCLTGSSRFTGDITLYGAVIGGDTTAHPAVSGSIAFGGAAHRNRITVDLSARYIEGQYAMNSTLRLDKWEQLSANGRLSAVYVTTDSSSPLIVPRTIVSVTSGTFIAGRTAIRLPNGRDALRGLSTVAAYGELELADVTPANGVLTLLPGLDRGAPFPKVLTLGSGDSTATVHGQIVNKARIDLEGNIQADALVDDGSISGDARTTCVTFGGDITMSSGARLATLLAVPTCSAMYTVAGSVTLDGALELSSPPRPLPVGRTVVIVDAAGGLQGQFATITGQSDGHGNHWQISYTATQVVAKLVAGPA